MHKLLFYNKFIVSLYMFRALCAHHQEVRIVLYSIWYNHICRWPSRAQVESGVVRLVNSVADGCILCSLASWIVTVYTYVSISRYYLFNHAGPL
jgi:hypothetical protein